MSRVVSRRAEEQTVVWLLAERTVHSVGRKLDEDQRGVLRRIGVSVCDNVSPAGDG